MKATASLLALAAFVIASSTALADPYRLHHDYYKLIRVSAAGTTTSTCVARKDWPIGVFRMAIVCAAGVVLAVALAAPVASGMASTPVGGMVSRSRLLTCMQNVGWLTVIGGSQRIVLRATDGHARVQLRFLISVAAAQASLPAFVPLGVGWDRNVSFVFAGLATLGDELALESCVDYG